MPERQARAAAGCLTGDAKPEPAKLEASKETGNADVAAAAA